MYKQKLALLSFLFLFVFSLDIRAQISVTPSVGCMPVGLLNANFVFSGGNPTNIVWNFGDGSATSNVNPSQHTYLSAGVYLVTFSASLNGLPISYTANAAVYQPPNGNFSYQIPPSRCLPMSVPFTASSTSTGMNFTWDFGDNTLGSGNNPIHIYNAAGSFTPILTIQDPSSGCFKNITSAPITVSSPPIIQLNVSPANYTCGTTFSPVFTASNSVSGSPLPGGTLTYSWSFGNSQNSTSANPTGINYTSQGVFTVNLIVKDNNFCSATTSTLISLISPTFNAIFPPVVCIKGQYTTTTAQVFSASIQSSEPFTTWAMGDGTTLTFPPSPTVLTSPTQIFFDSIYTYNSSGLKTITITATKGSCIAVQTKTILVEKVVAEFTDTPPTFTCNVNFPTTYINQTTVNSNSSLSYVWYVQQWPVNVQSFSTTNLNFTYSQNSSNPYTIYNTYAPNLKLYALSAVGCTNEAFHIFDTISRPTAFFNVDKAEGCVPLTVTFRDTSFYFRGTAPPTYTNSITSYTWYSGAGPTATMAGVLLSPLATNSVIPNFVYTYTATGVYSPSLTIQDSLGCTATSFVGTITVVNPPTISYSITSSTVCAGQPFQFTLSAGTSGPVQHWNVNTDDGFFSGCVSDATPTYKFTHLGQHTFTISAYKNSCKSTQVGTQTITVLGPLIKAWYKVTCFSNIVDYYIDLQDVTSATINYGDGSSPANAPIPGGGSFSVNLTHVYPGPGDYTVTLRAFNNANGCNLPYVQTLTVQIRNLDAIATVPSVICRGSLLALGGNSSIDVLKGGGKTYTWLFDNWPPLQTTYAGTNTSQSYSVLGIYTTTLVVKDVNGCVDYDVKTVRVSETIPSFTFNANPACVSNMPVQIINNTFQPLDPITLVIWNFGDGTPNATVTGNGTGPLLHAFSIGAVQSKTFQVTMNATNSVGCIAYMSHIITVNDPKINFVATTPGMCLPGGNMAFNIVAGSSHSYYLINWGDQTSSFSNTWTTNSTYTTSHPYATTGIYTPTVLLSDIGGCTNSLVMPPIFVQTSVVPTFTFFNIKNPATTGYQFCLPVTLSVTSTSDSLLFPMFYSWHSGKPSVNWTPGYSFVSGATYTTIGTYNYSLMLTTSPAGCTSTASKMLEIYDPKIDFIIIPDDNRSTYCLGDPITFKVTNATGTQFWDWDFGDGELRGPFNNINVQSVLLYENKYFPEQTNGMLTVQLVGKTAAPQCKDFKRRTLRVIRAFPDFKRNKELTEIDYNHCFGQKEIFTNMSTTNGTGLTYTWSLGNGAISTETNVNYTFPNPGFYIVNLFALESSASCTAEVGKPMNIFPIPNAKISVSDTLICPKDSFQITISGTPGVSGSLLGYLNPSQSGTINLPSSNSLIINTTALSTTNYTFSVRDENGCDSPPVESVILVQAPAPSVHTATTIIIGQKVQLNAHAGPGFSYSWTPQTANLNDSLIYNPVSNSTVDISYSVTIVDEPLHCFITVNTYSIFVLPLTTIDVPTAFTPNGDGTNDRIYVDGWGIKKLTYFKIFNRWGQLLFQTDDLLVGWDGTFEGVPQNIETYVYQAEAETYLESDPKVHKTGTFKLIR